MEHAGWRSRGYLPHCDAGGLFQHIIFGLADAIPDGPVEGEDRVAWFEAAFDSGHGSRLLSRPTAAEIMEATLLHDDGVRYRLLAWCVMPTHVHALAEQFDGSSLGDLVQSWKSVAAHRINAALGRSGQLWRREYFDRFMRDDSHLMATIAYIEHNPVAAGLALRPQDWRFSSARRRD